MSASPAQGTEATLRAYRRRMIIALVLSVLLHIAAFVPQWREPGPKIAREHETNDPIVIDLQPEAAPQQDVPQRLVDSAVESPLPPERTNLISDVNSVASDMSPGDDGGKAPAMAQGEFEQLGSSVPTPPPQPPQPPVAPSEADEAETTETDAPVEEPDEPEEPSEDRMVVAANPKPREVEMAERAAAAQTSPSAPAVPEVLPTPQQPPVPIDRQAPSQTPVEGEAQNYGFLGFEAMRHELAPYMKIVRAAVEKEWKIAIQMKYSGSEPTRAVLDCAISPDGKLVYANIVDPGKSVSHAVLCQKAIEKAGPFPPFPFDVPAMYRNENLQIRWTFSFL